MGLRPLSSISNALFERQEQRQHYRILLCDVQQNPGLLIYDIGKQLYWLLFSSL